MEEPTFLFSLVFMKIRKYCVYFFAIFFFPNINTGSFDEEEQTIKLNFFVYVYLSCFPLLGSADELVQCWKNCQLLEVRSSSPPPSPSETGGKNPEAEFPSLKRNQLNKAEKTEAKEERTTSQHPILACSTSTTSSNSAKPCVSPVFLFC